MTASPPTVTREAGTSRPARRTFGRRLSGSHLFIAAVVVLAFVLNYLALQDRESTTLVAVADRSLSAGSSLSVSDLRFAPLDSDFEAVGSLLVESAVGEVEGWILTGNVTEGQLIQRSMVIEPGAREGLRSMSFPVPIEHAAGGLLSAGDRIDVISVASGTAMYVVEGVEVLGVSDPQRGSLGGVSQYHLIVAVDEAEALALAEAIDSGSIEVIRATGVQERGGADGDT